MTAGRCHARCLVAAVAGLVAAGLMPVAVQACGVPRALELAPRRAWSEPGTVTGVSFATIVPRCPTTDLDIIREVNATLDQSGIVVLGELHDNPHHHRLRAELFVAAAHLQKSRARDPIAVVLEHLRQDQSTSILSDADAWRDTGWPPLPLFEPLFKVLGRDVIAGEPARGTVRDIARGGLSVVPEAEVKALALDQPLPPGAEERLRRDLDESHRGLVPQSALGSMVVAQRYRDAFMARAARGAVSPTRGAIVFTGNSHADKSRGIPFALRAQGFGGPVLVVLFREGSAVQPADPAIADIEVTTPAAIRP